MPSSRSPRRAATSSRSFRRRVAVKLARREAALVDERKSKEEPTTRSALDMLNDPRHADEGDVVTMPRTPWMVRRLQARAHPCSGRPTTPPRRSDARFDAPATSPPTPRAPADLRGPSSTFSDAGGAPEGPSDVMDVNPTPTRREEPGRARPDAAVRRAAKSSSGPAHLVGGDLVCVGGGADQRIDKRQGDLADKYRKDPAIQKLTGRRRSSSVSGSFLTRPWSIPEARAPPPRVTSRVPSQGGRSRADPRRGGCTDCAARAGEARASRQAQGGRGRAHAGEAARDVPEDRRGLPHRRAVRGLPGRRDFVDKLYVPTTWPASPRPSATSSRTSTRPRHSRWTTR